MTRIGRDSAIEPSYQQALDAKKAGVEWWAGYVGGSGAFHVWERRGWDNIREADLRPLPIWVPNDGILGLGSPNSDAGLAVERALAVGVEGVMVLDTEASMRGDVALFAYVSGFMNAIRQIGWIPVLYTGGFDANMVTPAYAQYQWRPGWGGLPSPGFAHQTGQVFENGLGVDLNVADDAFPLARWKDSIVTVSPQEVGLDWNDSQAWAVLIQTYLLLGRRPTQDEINWQVGVLRDPKGGAQNLFNALWNNGEAVKLRQQRGY